MVDKFHELLRQKGRSVTKARTILFQYLQASGPVSIKQFSDDNIAVADRASLYRTLTLFRQLGVVEERMIGGKRLVELSDAYDSHHHHFTCLQCGVSEALTMPHIEKALAVLCAAKGFTAESHTIEVNGLCAACNAKEGLL
jgi:Fur family transcriptional regulator, ferric uptake regulator